VGNLGDLKPVGQGVFEWRITFGPGHRVYFGKDGDTLVILLCGGTKKRQSKDIEQAKAYWDDYRLAKRKATDMPLTKDFKYTIKARAERDPEFRAGLFREAIEAMLSDDLETGKVLLRDYVNATVGFEALAQDMDKDPKSLMRMLSAKGNPRADNLLAMVSRLKQREGVSLSLTQGKQLHA
jgi:DNA-binding phage protein